MTGILRTYQVNNTNRSVDFFLLRNEDGSDNFDMDQPYQRGVVWGLRRKQNLIKSMLMGIPIPAIVVNNRFGAGFKHPGYDQDRLWAYSIVDGKQRVSTIRQFIDGKFPIPYRWFRDDEVAQNPCAALRYTHLTLPEQRHFRNVPLSVAEGQFPTLAMEEELFNLVNFGGLAQGEVDDDRE
jgi:hypothetical protein